MLGACPAGLSCLASAKPVVAEMSHITASQRWGLGRLEHTAFKGGWGPVGNSYLVRQVGLVTLSDGTKVAVAIAVWSPKGLHPGDRGPHDDCPLARQAAPLPPGRSLLRLAQVVRMRADRVRSSRSR